MSRLFVPGRRARCKQQRGHIPEAPRPCRRYAICQAVGRHVTGLVSGGPPCADGARSLRTGGAKGEEVRGGGGGGEGGLPCQPPSWTADSPWE